MEALARAEMVFGVGPAGTGKTYLAVAQAVAMLQAGRVDRIVLSRPAVEAGERLGFLPGDMKEKVDPYLRPLYDALHDMMPAEQVIRRLGNGEIEVAPLAFMRGRTLAHAFVILDEAQNTTAVQMKMLLTRMGEGTRMVVTGDLTQVDLPHGVRSGLRDALETLEGRAGHRGDPVRHARRGAPSAGRAHRRCLRSARGGRGRQAPRGPPCARVQPAGRGNRQVAMDPEASSGPAQAGIHGQVSVIVAEPAWRRLVPRAEAVAARAARAAGTGSAAIILAADRTVRRLNARHRGRDKPTNVLTYLAARRRRVVLALGVIRREAASAGRRPAHHLAHLVVHGVLHLPATTTITPARPAAWNWPRRASCTGCACPTRGSAHERERQRRAGVGGVAAAPSRGPAPAGALAARIDRRTGAGGRRTPSRRPASSRNWTARNAR